VIQNLYLNKTCVVNFQLNLTDCSTHNHTGESDSDHATEIQKYVSNLNIYGSLIENVPSIIMVLFLGPWSERNGRKLPMIIPIIGHICSVSMYILNYYFTSWPAEYILFASIPLGLCGGSATLLMALNRFFHLLYFVINHDNNSFSFVLTSTI
jgi:MFS family permease